MMLLNRSTVWLVFMKNFFDFGYLLPKMYSIWWLLFNFNVCHVLMDTSKNCIVSFYFHIKNIKQIIVNSNLKLCLTCIDEFFTLTNAIEEQSFSENDGRKKHKYYNSCRHGTNAFHVFQKVTSQLNHVNKLWNKKASKWEKTDDCPFANWIISTRLIWQTDAQDGIVPLNGS